MKKKWLLGVAAFFVVGLAFQAHYAPKPLTAQEKTAADQEKQLSERRYYQAAIAAKPVKKALRDPASVQWESVRVNDDGSLVCLVYRAKNGFGGMSLAPAVSIGGKISMDGNLWNKNCKGKTLYNLKDEVEIALSHAQ